MIEWQMILLVVFITTIVVLINNLFILFVGRLIRKNINSTIDRTGYHIKSNLETVKIIMGKGGK